MNLSFGAIGGISLVHDALVTALLHRPETDRRHLVVGMTDRRDCGSVVSSGQLRELTSRSEAVLHLVEQSGSNDDILYRLRTCSPHARMDGRDVIADAAARTGGALHKPSVLVWLVGPSSFRTIFEEFRQSYVLRVLAGGCAERRVACDRRQGAVDHRRDGRARRRYWTDDCERRPRQNAASASASGSGLLLVLRSQGGLNSNAE